MIGYFRPMSAPELDPLILSFYRSRYVEDERLTSTPHGRIGFLRTQQLLRSRLPTAPARIADVGGGTGVHARWLAADGHEVWVVDPVPEHGVDVRPPPAARDKVLVRTGPTPQVDRGVGDLEPLRQVVDRQPRGLPGP